jgi:hypothetical protein
MKGGLESYGKAIAMLEPVVAPGSGTDEEKGVARDGPYLGRGGIEVTAGKPAAAIADSRRGLALRGGAGALRARKRASPDGARAGAAIPRLPSPGERRRRRRGGAGSAAAGRNPEGPRARGPAKPVGAPRHAAEPVRVRDTARETRTDAGGPDEPARGRPRSPRLSAARSRRAPSIFATSGTRTSRSAEWRISSATRKPRSSPTADPAPRSGSSRRRIKRASMDASASP